MGRERESGRGESEDGGAEWWRGVVLLSPPRGKEGGPRWRARGDHGVGSTVAEEAVECRASYPPRARREAGGPAALTWRGDTATTA